MPPRPWTRRSFFFLPVVGLGAVDKNRQFPPDTRRYPDPSTEIAVNRLTDPAYQSRMPAYYGRAFSRHGNFMLFSCDRTGTMQSYRMDLKAGATRQLTEAKVLDPDSVSLFPDERSFCYFDGGELVQSPLNGGRARTLYQVPAGWEPGPGLSVAEDGMYAASIDRQAGQYRLRLLDLRKGTAETVAQANEPLRDPIVRPHRAGILYRRGNDALWLASYDGSQNYRLRVASGGLGPALWSPDGRSVLYLDFPEDHTKLNNIREFVTDANDDHSIAPTSQFVHFGHNADASVFVGASASKASPFILILLRSVKRELTMCEHKASDPTRVAPVFSPNSQHIYFHSDRHGKWAIYSMAVEKFVERTES